MLDLLVFLTKRSFNEKANGFSKVREKGFISLSKTLLTNQTLRARTGDEFLRIVGVF